jgi:hypothetical protein
MKPLKYLLALLFVSSALFAQVNTFNSEYFTKNFFTLYSSTTILTNYNVNVIGKITADSAQFNNLASGYLPYYGSTRLKNSGIYYNGTNVGIGPTTGIDSNLTVNRGGWFKRGLRVSSKFTVGDLSGVYSYINPGDALWTVSSDLSKKENIQDVSVNLANFSKVTPKKYTFKKEYFLEQFDEKSVPDSVDKQIKIPLVLRVLIKDKEGKEVLSDSLQTIKTSNKAKKDSIRTAFIANNLADASEKSKIVHTGFIAQQFNSNMFGSNSTEIDYNKIIVVMWMKIQELENRVKVLESK